MEGGRESKREGGRQDSSVFPGVQNSRCSKRRRVWLEVPCDLEMASLSGQPNSLPRQIHIQQGRKLTSRMKSSWSQSWKGWIWQPWGLRVGVREEDIRGARGQKVKIQWNVSAPLLLSFRIFFILGNLGRPAVNRDRLSGHGDG